MIERENAAKGEYDEVRGKSFRVDSALLEDGPDTRDLKGVERVGDISQGSARLVGD